MTTSGVLADAARFGEVAVIQPNAAWAEALLPELAEECNQAADRTQLILTSHSPFLVNGLEARQVWVLYRELDGYTRARRVADVPGIEEFIAEGAGLGDLWMEGYFEVGDPLSPEGD